MMKMAILCALDSVRRRFRLGNLPVLMYGYSAGGQCTALFSAFMKGEVAAWGAHGCGVNRRKPRGETSLLRQ